MTDAPASLPRSGAQAVERALAALRCVEGDDEGVGVTELAQRTSLTVSTAHRLARTLAEAGILHQDPRTERYQLGPALIVLGRKAEQRLGYRQALPLLEELAAVTGESINLGIHAGDEVRVVLDVVSRQPLRFAQTAGSRVPMHVSAMGKCLLANTGDDIADQIDRLGGHDRATHRTITDRDQLHEKLVLVRERRSGTLRAPISAVSVGRGRAADHQPRRTGWRTRLRLGTRRRRGSPRPRTRPGRTTPHLRHRLRTRRAGAAAACVRDN